MNGATSLATELLHDIPALLVERVTMAAMSDCCHPFTAALVNTVAANGLPGQLDHTAEIAEASLHTTQQTYTENWNSSNLTTERINKHDLLCSFCN